MTTFQDGPAQGKTLMLQRCPFFLRVVTKRGALDALDQVGDTPSPAESIHVYLRQPGAAMNAIHLNTGRKPGGGWFARADYKLSPVQPPEPILRNNADWQAWCQSSPLGAEAKPVHN